jgi:hypothetical protein
VYMLCCAAFCATQRVNVACCVHGVDPNHGPSSGRWSGFAVKILSQVTPYWAKILGEPCEAHLRGVPCAGPLRQRPRVSLGARHAVDVGQGDPLGLLARGGKVK